MSSSQIAVCFISIVFLFTTVTGHKTCDKNSQLLKSIQYQLKLVEDNGDKCDCRQGDHDQVGFLVLNSKALRNLGAGTIVIYDKIITNSGNGYDPNSGMFTAPSDGLYHFAWTTLAARGKQFCTWLVMNGQPIAKNHPVANHSSDYISASQNVVLKMKKMDKVVIKIIDGHTGQFMQSDDWSTFSGFKI